MSFTVKTFIAITGSGVERANCVNGKWQVEPLLDASVCALAVDPGDSAIVYAGTDGQGLLRSADQGRTWQPIGLAGRTVRAITHSRAERSVIYAGTKPPMLFVSRDDAITWREFDTFRSIPSRRWWRSPAEPGLTATVQRIALSPSDPRIIVVGIEAGAVVRSADGGRTWSDHRSGAVRDCHTLVPHPGSHEWMYEAGGTGAGVAVSRDAGGTWTQPGAGLDRHYGWACAADGVRADVWYASLSPMTVWPNPFVPAAHIDGKAHAYIFRSMNGGAWQKLNGGLPSPLMHMAYALLTDPTAGGHVYAGMANGEVWHSTDYGEQWERLPFKFSGIHRTLVML
jgi:hypothetical protein